MNEPHIATAKPSREQELLERIATLERTLENLALVETDGYTGGAARLVQSWIDEHGNRKDGK